jgi:hypothetical protein
VLEHAVAFAQVDVGAVLAAGVESLAVGRTLAAAVAHAVGDQPAGEHRGLDPVEAGVGQGQHDGVVGHGFFIRPRPGRT